MNDGVYLLYRKFPNAEGQVERRLVGAFAILHGSIHLMEDHEGFLERELAPGPLSIGKLRWMARMSLSPYWDLIREQNVAEGNDPDAIEELDLSDEAG